MTEANRPPNSHSVVLGYILWIFGFMGVHRFYYGKQLTGTLWFFTLGLCGIGWIIDLFLIPGMDRAADIKYTSGKIEYNVAWVIMAFLGIFGIHRFYLCKYWTGILWLLTGGLIGFGVVYDYWTLNDQISEINKSNL